MSEPRVYLVRHARAGSRSRWVGPDRARPLTEKGRRQADLIAARLVDCGITRVLTSPYTRCWETVGPLATKLGLLVEEAAGLAEGAFLTASVPVLQEAARGTTVLCTHGDVIGDLLGYIARLGVDLGPDPRLEKGSVWVLDVDGPRVSRAVYLPPPR